jgi:uncharacterized repeat protein (TIGR03803 family)
MRPLCLAPHGKLNLRNRACTLVLLCVTTVITSPAQTALKTKFKNLFEFNKKDGWGPVMSLIQGTDGNFYGTTEEGGAQINSDFCPNGCGTVFKVTPEGKLTTLYEFCRQGNCADGAIPLASLLQATDGEFYGTTSGGGDLVDCINGCGTRLQDEPQRRADYAAHVLYPKWVSGWDQPSRWTRSGDERRLLRNGGRGGDSNSCPGGCGTVFKITSAGKFGRVYSFCNQINCADGAAPLAALVQSSGGNFYGTTEVGGTSTNCEGGGCGTVFKITAAGKLATLHSFDSTDGASPFAGVVQGTNGSFYGTTYGGGPANSDCHPTCGTVFRIDSNGSFLTLHLFKGTDGSNPTAGLLQATDGNFYGTTDFGGSYVDCHQLLGPTCGTDFKITAGGDLTTLHIFYLPSFPAYPYGLVQGTDGNFYGATEQAEGGGTVYRLTVGLEPFVETRPTSGKIGASVVILGTNLTGATSVKFNGKAAEFTIISKSEIHTKVPAGATTGKVKVDTPHGTLVSNVAFRITK